MFSFTLISILMLVPAATTVVFSLLFSVVRRMSNKAHSSFDEQAMLHRA